MAQKHNSTIHRTPYGRAVISAFGVKVPHCSAYVMYSLTSAFFRCFEPPHRHDRALIAAASSIDVTAEV